MRRESQAGQMKIVKKKMKEFNKTLNVLNDLFHSLKDLDTVTPEMIQELSPITLDDKMIEFLIEDIENYESKN